MIRVHNRNIKTKINMKTKNINEYDINILYK